MARNIEILSAIFVLGFGICLGFIYSNYFGGAHSHQIKGALQLHSKEGYLSVPLIKKTLITNDTYIFQFRLPESDLPLGLETGQHVVIHADLAKKDQQIDNIQRKYTPVSLMNQTGTFDLLVKIYRAGVHSNFPDGGLMTQYLESLKIGDNIKISGPRGKLTYHGNGDILIDTPDRKQHLKVKRIGLIAGGTGITPMYQVIQDVLHNHQDTTHIDLLFGNRSEDDILLEKELPTAAKDARIKVHFTIDKATSTHWKGYTGYIDKKMIQETMPAPADDVLICTCGPRAMNEMLANLLHEMNYKEENIFKF